jgi:hypothetical protein
MKKANYCITQTSNLTKNKYTKEYKMKFLIQTDYPDQYFLIQMIDNDTNEINETFQLNGNEYYLCDCTDFMTSLNPDNKKSKLIKYKLYSVDDIDDDNKIFEAYGSFNMI